MNVLKKHIKKFLWNIRIQIGVVILSVVTIIAFIPLFTYLVFANDLESKDSIMNRNNTGLVVTDKNDKTFFTFYSAKYTNFIPLREIPLYTQRAIIAGEDRDFYHHPGFSIQGIIRSMYLNFQKGETLYGGSTITQQLVKNALLSSKKNILRKYQEIVLAQEIERRYRKAEILEMYLNSVYFGEGAFGIEQAARTYFNKSASKLTLSESALLAGILPAPSSYSPLSGKVEAAKVRQQYVLDSMYQMRYITKEQKEKAIRTQLMYSRSTDDINSIGMHFALMVKEELVRKYGEEAISRSGFKVNTTLDLSLQQFAEKTVADQVALLKKNNVSNGAAVIIDVNSGEVRALVGSRDWYDSDFGKYNVAIAPRSPGSSFKPIIYAKAIEERIITAATPLRDEPTTFPGNYKPQDYDRKYRGVVLVRRALANSLNIPSVEIMQKVGVTEALKIGKKFGLTTLKGPSDYGLSLVLGSAEVPLIEMTNVYATFANKGVKNNLTTVLSIKDKHNKTIYENKPKEEQILLPETAFIISSILSDNTARTEIFGNTLNTSRPAAVKTGTAEDYKDALTIGYTPRVAVGVWVGNNDGSPMDRVAGSLGAAPIWKALIEEASKGSPVETFSPPSGITTRSVCGYNGLLARSGIVQGKVEYFIAGTEPTRYCSLPRPSTSPTDPKVTTEPWYRSIPGFTNDKKNGRKNNRGGPSEEAIESAREEVARQI